MSLRIDWATHSAALYACQKWHYSKKIPVNKLVKIGAWENDKFIGVVIFGMGASAVLYRQFVGITRFECCELVRVALTKHETPVSRIIAIALKFLRQANPGIKVCVSFADPAEGHHGGIYQAGGWVYTGNSSSTVEYYFNGDWRHVTDVYKRLTPEQVKVLPKRTKRGKYRYVKAFDPDVQAQIDLLKKPYPKRAPEAEVSMRSDSIRKKSGSSPTPALQPPEQVRSSLRK